MIPNSYRVVLLSTVGLLSLGFLAVPVRARAASPELVLYLTDRSSLESAADQLRPLAGTIEVEPTLTAIRIPLISASSAGAVLAELPRLAGVRAVEHNVPFTSTSVERVAAATASQLTPNDPQLAAQTAIGQLNAPAAWELSQGSTRITIAVVDTGINGLHQEFVGRVIAGVNQLTGASIAAGSDSDDSGHGTEVAGVLAATGNDGRGIAGLDWHAQLMPVKVLGADGAGVGTDLANGIRYAADHGANVINLSLGGSSDSTAVRDAVAYALTKGSLVVAAAGNDGAEGILYPARYDGVVAVGSVSRLDGHSFFSNHGAELDLVAPGEGILTTRDSVAGNEYLTVSGTSIAAPFASGAAGLLMARSSASTMSDVRAALTATTDKPAGMTGQSFTTYYGHGRLNAGRLVSALDRYDAAYLTQSLAEHPGRYDVAFGPGETRTVSVKLRNSGTSTWYPGGATPTKLGTASPRDRTSPFLPTTHPGILQESEVPPGATGTFIFTLTAPNVQAEYVETFQAVTEQRSWFGPEVSFRILVAAHAAAYVTQGPHTGPGDVDQLFAPGETKPLTLTVKNTGDATWFRAGPYPAYVGPSRPEERAGSWLVSGRAQMDQAAVIPGQTATFTLTVRAPANATPGDYLEDYQLVIEHVAWIGPIVRWKLKVL